MTVEDGNGSLAVMRGALHVQDDSYATPFPASRPLERKDLPRVDAEEGISAVLTEELGGTGSRHSVYELVAMLGGIALVVLIIVVVLPMGRFHLSRLTRLTPTFASTVGPSSTALPLVGGLTSADRVLSEVKDLLAKRQYVDVMELCGRSLDQLGEDRAVHRSWSKVWATYLETLLLAGRRQELLKRCRRLSKVVPDSDVASYYRGRYWLGEIAESLAGRSLGGDRKRELTDVLQAMEKEYRFRARGDGDVAVNFGLLLAETLLSRWELEGCNTDEPGMVLVSDVIDRLRTLPETVQSVKIELRLWEQYLKVSRAWHSLKIFERRIRGIAVTRPWVERRIVELRERLGSLGVK